jgi:hypothetical protein
MRTVLLLVLAAALSGASHPAAAARTRVYLTFGSHNDYSGSNLPCRPVVQNQQRYAANRAALVAIARTIATRGGTYDFQTDWEYMSRVSQWDDEALKATTGGLNVIAYLARFAPDRVAVHAHSHENLGYNYADVAYLTEVMTGLPSTNLVGGYIAWPISAANWERFRNPMQGARYPQYVWRPTILWGGGSGDHRNDPNASGVWRPRSHADFYTDDPAQSLVNIGAYSFGSGDVSGAVDVVTRLMNGQLEPGRLYTATIMLEQCNMDIDPSIGALASAVLDAAAPYVARGDIVWATLPTVARVWREEYGSQPSTLRP